MHSSNCCVNFHDGDFKMNKKIKELKIQSLLWAVENAPTDQYEDLADEKFAELIIKNCADIADEMEAIRCPYPGDAIVESFGLGEDVGAANWRAKD